ncbi:hypothetical protein, partial [Methylobacterium sp. B1]|uniref:hypothetical protein n=1 Tax=Methylobacterium sp. B1 TaxID=91459 RepID=UPI0035B56257
MIRSAATTPTPKVPAPKRTTLAAAAFIATVGVALCGPAGPDAAATQPTPPASDAALSTAQVLSAEKAADPV